MTRVSTLDLPALHRATIGFDRLFDELDRQFANSPAQGYPPYNTVQINENEYVISLAVAGFSMHDLDITKEGNILHIEGQPRNTDDSIVYLHKGIAGRGFRRQFMLEHHMEIVEATLELGMLNIHLKRVIPEELQPKKIEIKNII